MTKFTLFARDLYDDLLERKLWPVALGLAIALVAVPVVLSKSGGSKPASAPVSAVPATGAGGAGGLSAITRFQPVVSGGSQASAADRKDLKGFSTQNPFDPKGIDLVAAAAAGNAEPLVPGGGGDATPTDAGSGDGQATPGSTAPSGDGSQEGTSQWIEFKAKVRFGEEGDAKTRTLSQFRPLPSTDNPVTIFMGVRTDGKTAVFQISSVATTTGDGDCQPSESSCTFLYMKAGDRQLIETVTAEGDVVDYELELVEIVTVKVKAPTASGSRTSRSSAHRGRSHRSDSRRARSARRAAKRRDRARSLRTARAFGRLSF